jgi:methyl-accepting chemotaxis protein
MFKNMKIGWRMGLGFGLVLVFMIALILVSLNEMENSHERLERIVKINNVRLQLTHEMIDDVRNVSIALRNILLLKNIGKTQETKNKIAETRKEYDANFEKVQGLTPKEDTKAWNIISKIKASQDASRQLNNKVFDLALAGKYDNALDLMTKEVSLAVHQWIEHVDDLIKYNEEYNKMRHDQIEKEQAAARTTMLIIGAAAIALSVLIIIFLTLSITGPLGQGVQMMREMAQGHLGMRFKMGRRDEIGILGDAMNQFSDDLQNVVIGAMKKIGDGDLSIEVLPKDSKDEISPALKATIESLRNLVAEANMLSKAGVEGKLSTRGNIDRFKGVYRGIIQGVNDSLDAVIGPLNVAAGYVERIAKGDIPQPITGKYNGDFEVFINNLNNMNTGLRDMLGNLQEAVNVLASSTNQILAGTAEMSTSATETATSVSETTTTMEEVKQTAKQMSHNATVVSETAQGTAQLSELGKKSVEDTISVMGKIKEQVDFVANNIVKLSEQSQAIGAIISSVNDLSNQSNLLAVNASIEAAKAGEQGKGFAVVAQEVRSLAEQSKEATNQVRTILNDIQKAISGAVMATEQSAKAVEAGMNQSQTAGDSIGKMTEGIMKSVQTAIQIAASTNEQVAGIEQVASAMENIKKATEQIALSTRQSQESAKNMHELGAKLKQMVEKYKV